MIQELFNKYTRYDLLEPKSTVIYWVKAQINVLVKEKIGFGTYVDQDNFKAVIQIFQN